MALRVPILLRKEFGNDLGDPLAREAIAEWFVNSLERVALPGLGSGMISRENDYAIAAISSNTTADKAETETDKTDTETDNGKKKQRRPLTPVQQAALDTLNREKKKDPRLTLKQFCTDYCDKRRDLNENTLLRISRAAHAGEHALNATFKTGKTDMSVCSVKPGWLNSPCYITPTENLTYAGIFRTHHRPSCRNLRSARLEDPPNR